MSAGQRVTDRSVGTRGKSPHRERTDHVRTGGRGDHVDAVAVERVLADVATALGIDLGGLTVHIDDESAARTSSKRASGLSSGRRIDLDPATFDPRTRRGRALLAHEAVHVAQRDEGARVPARRRPSVAAAEREARDAERPFRRWSRAAPAARHAARRTHRGRRRLARSRRPREGVERGRRIRPGVATDGVGHAGRRLRRRRLDRRRAHRPGRRRPRRRVDRRRSLSRPLPRTRLAASPSSSASPPPTVSSTARCVIAAMAALDQQGARAGDAGRHRGDRAPRPRGARAATCSSSPCRGCLRRCSRSCSPRSQPIWNGHSAGTNCSTASTSA